MVYVNPTTGLRHQGVPAGAAPYGECLAAACERIGAETTWRFLHLKALDHGAIITQTVMSVERYYALVGIDASCVQRLIPGSKPNARHQVWQTAGATQLGSDKAQSQQARLLIAPVQNRTCHFDGIRLSTFDRSPWRGHEVSVPIAPVPQVCTRVQLARALGTFVSLFSQARGLRRQSPSWCTRLFPCSDSYAPSTLCGSPVPA